jgi:RNA polymerase sigma-70 factor (ECF subfamily)
LPVTRVAFRRANLLLLPGGGMNTAYMANAEAEPTLAVSEDKVDTFARAVEQHRAQLLWLAQRMTPYREEAEDIVQDALVKAFRNLEQFRGDSQMSTWLRAIVQNTARDWLRNQKGRVYLSLDQPHPSDGGTIPLELPHPAENPEERCERKQMEWLLRSEIGKLNSASRRAIQLCIFDQLSHRAAANALNISVITVKSRVFSGKQQLKRAMCMHTQGRHTATHAGRNH